jgi:Cyclic nucleotide-binding domain/N-acyl amino acid synthase FeeM
MATLQARLSHAPATQEPVIALDGLEPVYEALTDAEREAIWAFRYRIYVEELGRKLGNADHVRGWVHDPDDDEPGTIHLYTRDADGITGVQRARFWAPGTIPAKDFSAFSLERFPAIETLAAGELGRLMVKRDARGTTVLASLLSAAYELGAGRLGADLAFLNCAPGLVRLYRMLGCRPYCGRLVRTPDGSEVPLVLVMSDVERMAETGSLFLPLAQRHFAPEGPRPRLDLTPFDHLFEAAAVPLKDDPAEVAAALAERLGVLAGDGLGADTIARLAGHGMLLSLEAGELLMEKGLGQREVFIVTDGRFEAFDGERSLRLLSEGDAIGEVAFFSTSGRRSASVRAVTDGQVLVLRHGALKRLRAQDPACAAAVLFHLARTLADRLVPA